MGLSENKERIAVQVARIDERVRALSDDMHELKEAQKLHREESSKILQEIRTRVGEQNRSIEQYRNDRVWVIGIFGTLYAALLTWVKSKVGA